MLALAWPFMLAVLPAPALVAWLAPPAHPRADGALRVPFFNASPDWTGTGGRRAPRLVALAAALAWVLLVLAASRPQWIGEPIGLPITGRDLLLAVDLSGTMRTRDLTLGDTPTSRLEVVKQVAGEFIARREGDRVGLVLFGTRAYLQAPLTFDRISVGEMLAEAVIGLAGDQTAIGDAIGLAVKRLRERPAGNRVLVLLTDGANTAGEVEPLDAGRLAIVEGLRIYTIGVGGEALRKDGVLGTRRVNPSADLDEAVLAALAAMTGGRYFRARDTAELEHIYMLIDELEPAAEAEALLRPAVEMFHWPLAGAVAMTAIAGALLLPPIAGWRGRPREGPGG